MKLPADQDVLRRGGETLGPFLKVLYGQLEGRRFIVGDRLTLADCNIAGPFSQYIRSKVPFPDYPNVIARHHRLIDEVPARRHTRAQLEERIIEISRDFGVDLEVGEH